MSSRRNNVPTLPSHQPPQPGSSSWSCLAPASTIWSLPLPRMPFPDYRVPPHRPCHKALRQVPSEGAEYWAVSPARPQVSEHRAGWPQTPPHCIPCPQHQTELPFSLYFCVPSCLGCGARRTGSGPDGEITGGLRAGDPEEQRRRDQHRGQTMPGSLSFLSQPKMPSTPDDHRPDEIHPCSL